MAENGNPFDSLDGKRVQAIEALLTTSGYMEAAARVGITRQTLRQWLREPEFKAAFRAAKQDAFEEISLGLLMLASKARTAMVDVLDNPSAPGSAVKRAAANDVYSHLFKLRDTWEVEDRLEALEARLDAQAEGY